MTEDLLSQIKQKAQQRKDVPTRNTSLLGSSSSEKLSPELETTQNFLPQNPLLETSPEVEDLPQISKRLAVRLEDELRDQLEMLCKYEKITPETFLEAAFVICKSNPGTMAMVMAEAKERYGRRKIAGELRRLKTINQKYQQRT